MNASVGQKFKDHSTEEKGENKEMLKLKNQKGITYAYVSVFQRH